MRSLWSKTFSGKRESPAERAERAHAEQRYADAAALYRTMAEAGDAAAQVRLAQLYEHGQGVLQSFVAAARWYREAAKLGSVPAAARLGEIYLTGLEPPPTASASAVARIHASEGEASLLTRMFPEGLAVPRDTAQAAEWNRTAAEAGDAGAQARLGYQYAAQLGVARDLALAEHWFSAAAAQNHISGQLG